MKNILVTGAAGQIGSELVPALRDRFGSDQVVAAAHSTALPDDINLSGQTTTIDVTDYLDLEKAVIDFGVDRIFHMGSILSATAENRRESPCGAAGFDFLANDRVSVHPCGVGRLCLLGPHTAVVHVHGRHLTSILVFIY